MLISRMATMGDNIRENRSGRIHICHLTVLNPARHSRIFFKEARSQVQDGYQVTIIGQDASPEPYEVEGVKIIPTGIFGRLGWKRWSARRKVIGLAAQQNADIYQIHAPELLGPARKLLKLNPAPRLIYDMHEDYALNIREGGYYPWWIRRSLAHSLRKAEEKFARYGHGLIYAEDCFDGLLDFPQERRAFVRNKYLAPPSVTEPASFGDPALPLLVYTGTIAENWGAHRAMWLWQKLQDFCPVRLAVVGHSHNAGLIKEIRDLAASSGLEDKFLLVGGDQYVPYEVMAGWIAAADAGIALYTLRPNIRERIPTKFYEFMAAGHPVIHTPNPAWDGTFNPAELGIPLAWPPDEAQLSALAERLKALRNHPSPLSSPEKAWSWDTEAENLSRLIRAVLALPK